MVCLDRPVLRAISARDTERSRSRRSTTRRTDCCRATGDEGASGMGLNPISQYAELIPRLICRQGAWCKDFSPSKAMYCNLVPYPRVICSRCLQIGSVVLVLTFNSRALEALG